MKNSRVLASTFTFLAALLAGAASASACDSAPYEHNGSQMEVHACPDGRMTISYDVPKPSLQRIGVRGGTLLFTGNFWDSGGSNLRRVRGTAFLFKPGCQPAGYEVEGYWLADGSLSLSGTAPVRRSGCTVSGYRQDDLLFLQM